MGVHHSHPEDLANIPGNIGSVVTVATHLAPMELPTDAFTTPQKHCRQIVDPALQGVIEDRTAHFADLPLSDCSE
jgi:hypothetical protein